MSAEHGRPAVATMTMSTRPVVVGAEFCLRDVAVCLREAGVGAALVMRGGRLLGILSERDVVVALANDADPDTVWAADVMTPEPIWAEPEDSLDRVLELMVEGGVRHLPVMAEGSKLLGVVSLRDVAAAILGRWAPS